MRRTWIAASAIALVVLAPVCVAALVAGDRPGAVAPAPALSPGAERLGEFKQLGVFANNVSESEEFPAAADAEAYANRAYPQNAIAFQQTLGAITAAKRLKSRGASYPSKWVDVGPDTMQVAQLGTQHWGRPTQWSGRVSAMAVDTRHCSASACKLYIGAAGGGVWRTNNALAERPNWKELSTGMDSQAIGSILIDPNDATGNTIYVGTGEPNGSSDSEAGVGLYRSTDGGNHWTLVPGSRAAAANRGIGGIVVDPSNPDHILLGTAVARHGVSSTSGGRFTPPGAPRLGLWESRDGGATFQLVFSRPQDVVNPDSPNGSDFYRGGITDLEVDPQAPGTFYFTMYNEGVFRGSFATPAAPAQIFTEPLPDGPGGNGIRYQIASAALPDGRTRIYLGQGSNRVGQFPYTDASKVRRTDDARAASVQWTTLSSNVRGSQAYSTWDFCRDQCWYDMPIASPPGRPDEVWVGGVTQYQELPTRGGVDRNMSNGRALDALARCGRDLDRHERRRVPVAQLERNPSRPARDPLRAGRDRDHRARRRRHAHERDVRRLLGRVRQPVPRPREPAAAAADVPHVAEVDPDGDHRPQRRAVHAAVPGPRGRRDRPAQRHPGRDAGQRLAGDDERLLGAQRPRRRRPARDRRERRHALPRVHRHTVRRELRGERPGKLDLDLRPDGVQRPGVRVLRAARGRPGRQRVGVRRDAERLADEDRRQRGQAVPPRPLQHRLRRPRVHGRQLGVRRLGPPRRRSGRPFRRAGSGQGRRNRRLRRADRAGAVRPVDDVGRHAPRPAVHLAERRCRACVAP